MTIVQSVCDLPLPPLTNGESFDSAVSDLIRILTAMGIETEGSCAAHIENGEWQFPWQYPWVSVWQLYTNSVLPPLLDAFNAQSDISWIVAGHLLCPDVIAHSEEELENLQRSAGELAQFLFERWRENTICNHD